ncbi:MAG: hypothetical protein ACPLSK_00985, partial [bacterium]
MKLFLPFLLTLSLLSFPAEEMRCSLTSQGLYITIKGKGIVRRSSFTVISQDKVIYDSGKRKAVIKEEGNSFIWQ